MAVLMTDEPDHVTNAPPAVQHIKRAENTEKKLTPTLCGSRYAPGVVVDEGAEPGSPWPYDAWCVECKDRQFGDYDDPLQPTSGGPTKE